jgi:hypothetical protein
MKSPPPSLVDRTYDNFFFKSNMYVWDSGSLGGKYDESFLGYGAV